jgi:hypothetical protein
VAMGDGPRLAGIVTAAVLTSMINDPGPGGATMLVHLPDPSPDGRGLTAAGPTSAAMLLVRVVTFWLSVPASAAR